MRRIAIPTGAGASKSFGNLLTNEILPVTRNAGKLFLDYTEEFGASEWPQRLDSDLATGVSSDRRRPLSAQSLFTPSGDRGPLAIPRHRSRNSFTQERRRKR